MQNNYKQTTNCRKKVEHLYLNKNLISTKRKKVIARSCGNPGDKAKLLARSKLDNSYQATCVLLSC